MVIVLSGCGEPETNSNEITTSTGLTTVSPNDEDYILQQCTPGAKLSKNQAGEIGVESDAEWELIIMGKETNGCHAQYKMLGMNGDKEEEFVFDMYFDEQGEIISVNKAVS